MKTILAISGIRSEYDILFPIIKKLSSDDRFRVKLVVTGAHLTDWHGNGLEEIRRDGFEIADQIDSLYMTNRPTQRVKGVGSLVTALSQTVERESPDVLIVVGDREESLATAVVGNYMNVVVAHVGGGDTVFGNEDDPVRFAVSKLAHLHFTTCEQYADNLKRIGEEGFRVICTGNPSLDNIRETERLDIGELRRQLTWNIESGKYVVLINHPLSSEREAAGSQMGTTLDGLARFSEKHDFLVLVSRPNTDPGAYDIVAAMERYRDNRRFIFYKNLSHAVFVNVMHHARALIGNSSMGILEAPYYGLPVVNVGNRQRGRLNAGNVEFVDHDKQLIEKALERACFDAGYREAVRGLVNPYGDGHAADTIVNALAAMDLSDKKWYVKETLC